MTHKDEECLWFKTIEELHETDIPHEDKKEIALKKRLPKWLHEQVNEHLEKEYGIKVQEN